MLTATSRQQTVNDAAADPYCQALIFRRQISQVKAMAKAEGLQEVTAFAVVAVMKSDPCQ